MNGKITVFIIVLAILIIAGLVLKMGGAEINGSQKRAEIENNRATGVVPATSASVTTPSSSSVAIPSSVHN